MSHCDIQPQFLCTKMFVFCVDVQSVHLQSSCQRDEMSQLLNVQWTFRLDQNVQWMLCWWTSCPGTRLWFGAKERELGEAGLDRPGFARAKRLLQEGSRPDQRLQNSVIPLCLPLKPQGPKLKDSTNSFRFRKSSNCEPFLGSARERSPEPFSLRNKYFYQQT